MLSTKEFQILSFLAENEDLIVSREHIYEAVWCTSDRSGIHTVTVHTKNLRAKIDPDNQKIKTVWGAGYMFTGVRG